MTKPRLKLIILLLILLPTILSGCLNPEVKESNQGQLQVAVQIPHELLGKMNPQFVDHQITLSSLTITVTQNQTVYTQTVPVEGELVSVTFDNLSTGEWNIEVIATDTDGYAVFSGAGVGIVENNVLTPVYITLTMLPGDLTLQVLYPAELEVAYAQITLINLVDPTSNISEDLAIEGGTGLVSLFQLTPTTWPVEVHLFNTLLEEVASGRGQIDILPGRVTTAQLSINPAVEGGLEIIIGWGLGPSAPTGLTAEVSGTDVVLSWNANPEENIAGYSVYRSTSLDGSKFLLTTSLVQTPTYTDTTAEPEMTYWYWVQAYSSFGFCSYLSQPVTCQVVIATLNRIAFTSLRNGNGDIYSINPDGTGLQQLTTWSFGDSDPKWSPDGAKIAYFSYRDNSDQLMLMNADGTNQVQLTADTQGVKLMSDWSPDGTKIAYVQLVNDTNPEIFVINADGTGKSQLTTNPGYDVDVMWSPLGDKLCYVSDANGAREIWVMNPDGTGKFCLTAAGYWEGNPAWSHDGARIAFTRTINGDDDIYVMNADGSNLLRLTSDLTDSQVPVWSPDDTQIAFRSNREGYYNICVMDASGVNQTTLTWQTTGFDFFPVWSPDGSQIAFISSRDGNEELYIINADGTGEMNLTNYPSGYDDLCDWSPF